MIQASSQKCCEKKCEQMAVAFWPVTDPDIPSYPYCRKHLDEAKIKMIVEIQKIDKQ